ncbi:hypothetical protein EOL94_03975 [bacterium]|nr:hypothetical protein [bacterium]
MNFENINTTNKKELIEKENEIWKGTEFWTKEIEKAEILENLNFFNDVIVEKKPPHKDSGYGEPILKDIILDNKNTDIYHSDQNKKEKTTLNRVFIHIKE